MKKKLLSWFLVMMMAMGLMTTAAFAAEGDVAQIGETSYATLGAAIAAVQDGQTITLLADCAENVEITQKKDVSFTIDGDGKTYTGTMTIDGAKRSTGAETLTIKNVNFVLGGEWQSGIAAKKSTLVHNLTVEDCSFTGQDAGYKQSYGIVLRHSYNVVVKDTEGTGLFDLVYGNTAVTGFTAENVTVTDSTNGIWLSYVNSTAEFNNVNMEVDQVGLGFLNNANNGVVTIENASINADSAVYLGQKSESNKVEVVVNELNGTAPLMVDVDSTNGMYNVILNDASLEKNTDGDVVKKEPVYIGTAEELVAFRDAVNGGEDFAGVTVYLTADIDLKDHKECNVNYQGNDVESSTFRPIGEDTAFMGTFDGQGHTISNLSQSGWDLGYQWGVYGSLGLFAEIKDATIKNLTIEGAECVVEGGDVAAIAGSATGTCVFENITIKDSVMATYNNGCGSIIAWSGAGEYTFKNINIESDVVLAGLWGSFDSSIGGVVGQAEPGATYNFENVDIACRIDAYNDCTASYDYYNYRMCGMIMGRLEETTTIDGRNYPDTSKYNITCSNVKVTYGDWYDYHYCDPTPGYNNGRGMRVEPGYAYDGLPADYDHSACTTNHTQVMPFDQIFGGAQYGVKGLKSYTGVEVEYPAEKNHNLQTMVNSATASVPVVLTEDLCEVCGARVDKNIIVTGAEGAEIPVDTDKAFTVVDGGSVSIIGGTYKHKPDNYVANGYKAVYNSLDGNWVVKPEGTTVTITFESNGGSAVAPQTVVFGESATAATPTRPGYNFAGWYANSDLTTAYDFTTAVIDDITLYAKWTAIAYDNDDYDYEPTYRVETDSDIDNGSVSTRVKYASSGDTVSITVTPDEGYELDTLTVTDSKGNEIEVTYKNGKYTFKMPARKVTIDATFVSAEELPFADVDADDWFYDAVKYAYDNDIMAGVGGGKFGPNAELTRAMVAQVLYNLDEDRYTAASALFNDVIAGEWYVTAIDWAVAEGIFAGYGNGYFGTLDSVTREQMAVILYNYAVSKGYAVSGTTTLGMYADADKTSTWAVGAMEWAVANGVLLSNDGLLTPTAPASRAEVAYAMMMFCENIMG